MQKDTKPDKNGTVVALQNGQLTFYERSMTRKCIPTTSFIGSGKPSDIFQAHVTLYVQEYFSCLLRELCLRLPIISRLLSLFLFERS